MLIETVLSKSTRKHIKSKACHPYDKIHWVGMRQSSPGVRVPGLWWRLIGSRITKPIHRWIVLISYMASRCQNFYYENQIFTTFPRIQEILAGAGKNKFPGFYELFITSEGNITHVHTCMHTPHSHKILSHPSPRNQKVHSTIPIYSQTGSAGDLFQLMLLVDDGTGT